MIPESVMFPGMETAKIYSLCRHVDALLSILVSTLRSPYCNVAFFYNVSYIILRSYKMLRMSFLHVVFSHEQALSRTSCIL